MEMHTEIHPEMHVVTGKDFRQLPQRDFDPGDAAVMKPALGDLFTR
jgi:hypothetical protein